jgi:salicylate biosynthesis isochorismate synthase
MTIAGSAELERAVGAAVQRVRDAGERVIVGCSLDVPPVEDALTLTGQWQSAGHGFFWERPADRLAIAAGGATAVVCAEGPNRFEAVSAQCRAWRERIVSVGEAPVRPLFVGGFAFADHATGQGAWAGVPAARMVLPRWVVVQEGARATLTVNVTVERALAGAELAQEVGRTIAAFDRGCGTDEPEAMPSGRPCYETEAVPSVARWQDAIVQAIADIRSGHLQKLVLARSCRVRSSVPFNCARVAGRLRETHPACTTFWIRSPEGDFVGATPELLVRQAGEVVCTQAIAGSSARGDSAAEDRALGNALMTSAKERAEHQVVVRALAEALAPLCRSVDVGGEPQILPLAHVQHLVTRLRGRLARAHGVLDVVARLHPTPAVGGFPRAAALANLRDREQMERGWYAGPIGWTRGDADGEFAVALRCALVRGAEAVLYAGAGIVAQSEPHAELAETRLKFQALLSALTEC